MKLKYLFLTVLLLIVLVGCGEKQVQPIPAVEPTPEPVVIEEEQVVVEEEPVVEEVVEVPAVPVEATVTYSDAGFEPAEVTVSVGGKVTWKHEGTKPLIVNSKKNLFQSNRLTTGGIFEFAFEEAGEYEYINSVLASQKGKVIVK